jgi:hypothetical protein
MTRAISIKDQQAVIQTCTWSALLLHMTAQAFKTSNIKTGVATVFYVMPYYTHNSKALDKWTK